MEYRPYEANDLALAQELGANVSFIKTDVTDAAQVAAAVETAVRQQGGLHFLITTAGCCSHRPAPAHALRALRPSVTA